MNKDVELEIWGRKINININFDCYEDEEITANQIDAYNKFIEKSDTIFKNLYYKFEIYCNENYKEKIEDNFENIFKYVIPKSLYIKRSKDDTRIIGVMCNFKFEPEHGLVAVFKNELFEKIDIQDAIL